LFGRQALLRVSVGSPEASLAFFAHHRSDIIFLVKKSELLRAFQFEIQRHNLSTFMDEKDKIVITGCTLCRKNFGTVEQFKRHISEHVLPPLLDKLSAVN
jgi:hypothetical protein